MTGSFVTPVCRDPAHCVTCGDDGVAMTVASLDAEQSLASCRDADGAEVDVEVALVAPVAVGDEVLVHAGVALTRLERG